MWKLQVVKKMRFKREKQINQKLKCYRRMLDNQLKLCKRRKTKEIQEKIKLNREKQTKPEDIML